MSIPDIVVEILDQAIGERDRARSLAAAFEAELETSNRELDRLRSANASLTAELDRLKARAS